MLLDFYHIGVAERGETENLDGCSVTMAEMLGRCVVSLVRLDYSALDWRELSIMGRIFYEHLGGKRIFSCETCEMYLSNRHEVLSTNFRGFSFFFAFLFFTSFPLRKLLCAFR
ncbi:Protein yippee-like 5 [Toxocara canis]|uniref:Protein yippee-like 5 n=1 Tax=Toxocara canis TaxID=6265 RepID=A0A0B2VF77_TOXCA|nr:Protein yippee-like 5 [Toxocara canis]